MADEQFETNFSAHVFLFRFNRFINFLHDQLKIKAKENLHWETFSRPEVSHKKNANLISWRRFHCVKWSINVRLMIVHEELISKKTKLNEVNPSDDRCKNQKARQDWVLITASQSVGAFNENLTFLVVSLCFFKFIRRWIVVSRKKFLLLINLSFFNECKQSFCVFSQKALFAHRTILLKETISNFLCQLRLLDSGAGSLYVEIAKSFWKHRRTTMAGWEGN